MRPCNRGVFAARRSAGLVPVACALLLAVGSVPASSSSPPCTVEGAWLCQADVGAVFFKVANRGSSATNGTLFVDWVAMDPTLFGNFPDAVRLTQGVGVWNTVIAEDSDRPRGYHYTWMGYGLGADGLPVYVLLVSGTDTLQGCDAVTFDYTMEIFLASQNPFVDDPVACMAGTGVKQRIPVTTGSCE